jgi:hypothetical protein
MLRRRLMKFMAAPLLAGLNPCGAEAANSAPAMTEAVLPDVAPSDPPIARRWISPPNCYFAYPHNNGFLPNGNPVLGQIGEDGHSLTYLEWDFRSGETRPIFQTTTNNMYWDIATQTGDLVAQQNRNTIVAVPTQGGGKPETILHIDATKSARLEDLVSINAAGDKVLYAVEKSDNDPGNIRAAELYELDRRTGATTLLCAMPFDADHQHYCPYDETWIGFAHEGDIRKSLDRVWAMNRGRDGGQPFRMWDETLADEGVGYVGHERWAFHAAGELVVAYPESPGRPLGLYFIDAATKRARLISASGYDWHCNISRDGAWAVVDTARPTRRPREADGRTISDVVLVNMQTGERYWLARSHMQAMHPWHPHPHFSPDGKQVIYNDHKLRGKSAVSYVTINELH